MKSKNIFQSLGLAVVLGVSAGALAHGNDDYRPGIDSQAFHKHPVFQENLRLMKEVNERQDRQLGRILDGFYEKRITLLEFRKLMDEQRDIQRMERFFLADGVLSRFEYQKLDATLDAASRRIFKEKHDAQGHSSYDGAYDNWKR